MSDPKPVIVWFEQDLRLADNPALIAAAQTGQPVLPLFILEDGTDDPWPLGGASRWWLHHSLAALRAALAARGMPLVIRRGDPALVLAEIVAGTGATQIFRNQRFDSHGRTRDRRIADALASFGGVRLTRCNGGMLFDPEAIATGSGDRFKTFSPFWRAATKGYEPPRPLPEPAELHPPEAVPGGLALTDLNLLPRPDWAGGIAATWVPGELQARRAVAAFIDERLHAYANDRDRPDLDGTARLSPHLRWGEISARQVWHAVRAAQARAPGNGFNRNAETFLRELGWREFSYYLLYHFPDLPDSPLNGRFESFPWTPNPGHLEAWQQGLTGYPIVDAGMRQLWETGWLHNRVRMVVGSFLVKHLLQRWQDGARWFWDTLVDADLANNSAGWQWVSGCGVDAAPYFRVFNPVLQGERHDPDGQYIRQYVPELGRLSAEFIHKPWLAPPLVLREAGVSLGRNYPLPIIDHASGRARALAAYQDVQAEARRRA